MPFQKNSSVISCWERGVLDLVHRVICGGAWRRLPEVTADLLPETPRPRAQITWGLGSADAGLIKRAVMDSRRYLLSRPVCVLSSMARGLLGASWEPRSSRGEWGVREGAGCVIAWPGCPALGSCVTQGWLLASLSHVSSAVPWESYTRPHPSEALCSTQGLQVGRSPTPSPPPGVPVRWYCGQC